MGAPRGVGARVSRQQHEDIRDSGRSEVVQIRLQIGDPAGIYRF